MKRVMGRAAAAWAAVALWSACLPALATLAQAETVPPHLVPLTFRLHVSGAPDPGATYWVAYGPLDGTWGLVRLRPNRAGWYRGKRSFPDGRTSFAYLVGRGRVRTALGWAPGAPVVTITILGPVSVGGFSPPAVRWQTPIG